MDHRADVSCGRVCFSSFRVFFAWFAWFVVSSLYFAERSSSHWKNEPRTTLTTRKRHEKELDSKDSIDSPDSIRR